MERLMQYVWQYRLIPPGPLFTVEGQRVRIVNPGMINTDAGPDFLNADIYIDGQQWVGNIEVHTRASDWFRHNHHQDPAYDSIILHIVDIDDAPIYRANGQRIPQLQLRCTPDLNAHLHSLVDTSPDRLPCADFLKTMPSVYVTDWISSLSLARLQQRAQNITAIAESLDNDWESAAYIYFARALGFSRNADPFERLARATPLSVLRKHANDQSVLEAILFGQSGLLDNAPADNHYVNLLKEEYAFYQHKFDLHQPKPIIWQLGRMRPATFPHRRIALLARVVRDNPFSKYINPDSPPSLEELVDSLNIDLEGFWSTHYTFTSDAAPCPINMTKQSILLLIINAVVPIMYAWGSYYNRPGLIDHAVELLGDIRPEDNVHTRHFTQLGIACKDALTSQGMIHLRRQYCQMRQCLNCRIGHRLLSYKSQRQPDQPLRLF
ncbi:MAG: DUF2851 family protein [Muribaculaceae bacterium]|nr:DUF2851 family protein [Muribaculaceae bacterium]